jgi:hypothetical protein
MVKNHTAQAIPMTEVLAELDALRPTKQVAKPLSPASQ